MPKKVKIIEVKKNENPDFIKPILITCVRENVEFNWEMVKSKNSVHIIVDNIDEKELLLVKQVRIPVLFNDDSQNGVMYEICAGLVDKENKTIEEIAREEVLEELGYDIPLSNIKYIRSLKSSVGASGTNASIFYAQVENKYKISNGGGIGTEDIKIFNLKYEDIDDFMKNEQIHTDALVQYSLYYWKNEIKKK
jgi:UDP-sugar diphosphatase